MDAGEFITTPSTTNKIINLEGTCNGAMVEYTIQSQFNNSPIYEIGNEELIGYQSFKVSDIARGTAINSIAAPPMNNGYVLKEGGKRYLSGHTYFLGYTEVLIPAYG